MQEPSDAVVTVWIEFRLLRLADGTPTNWTRPIGRRKAKRRRGNGGGKKTDTETSLNGLAAQSKTRYQRRGTTGHAEESISLTIPELGDKLIYLGRWSSTSSYPDALSSARFCYLFVALYRIVTQLITFFCGSNLLRLDVCPASVCFFSTGCYSKFSNLVFLFVVEASLGFGGVIRGFDSFLLFLGLALFLRRQPVSVSRSLFMLLPFHR